MKLMRKKGMKGLRWCQATPIPYPRPPSPPCLLAWEVWREEFGAGVRSFDSSSEFEENRPGTSSVSMSCEAKKAGFLFYQESAGHSLVSRNQLQGTCGRKHTTQGVLVVWFLLRVRPSVVQGCTVPLNVCCSPSVLSSTQLSPLFYCVRFFFPNL